MQARSWKVMKVMLRKGNPMILAMASTGNGEWERMGHRQDLGS